MTDEQSDHVESHDQSDDVRRSDRSDDVGSSEQSRQSHGSVAPSGDRAASSDAPATADESVGFGETAGPDAAAPDDPNLSFFGRRRARRTARRATPKRKAPWWELPALVLLAIVIAIIVKSFVVQPFYIPSESMEHTLHGCTGCRGDRILVNKVIYDFRDPEPGDIVVFDAPKGWDDETGTTPPGNPVLRVVRGFGQLIGFIPPDGEVLVKRVIASGGQSIKGESDGSVYVHDPGKPWRKLNEPYVFRDNPNDGDMGHAKFGPVTVPSGRLWVMGDHRDNSADSRYHCSADGDSADANVDDCAKYVTQATVSDDSVIGKAFVIAWPPSRWRTLGTPSTFDAAGAPLVPSAAPILGVLPFYLLRRRRRRR